jgi:hypothetical protein
MVDLGPLQRGLKLQRRVASCANLNRSDKIALKTADCGKTVRAA